MKKFNIMQPKAIVTDKSIDMAKCIEILAAREGNVYLVDNNGSYRWLAAQIGKSHIVKTASGDWGLQFMQLPPIVHDSPIQEQSLPVLQSFAEQFLATNHGVEEFPIVSGGGRIVSVLCTEPPAPPTLNWRIEVHINSSTVMPKGKIWLSSRRSPRMKAFYDYWRTKLDVGFLTEGDWQAVLAGENGTLLYEEDIFPDCPKLNLEDLYERLHKAYFERMANGWYMLRDNWASMPSARRNDLPLLISKFDEGYEAVYICDDAGQYQGTVPAEAFRRNFPKSECADFDRKRKAAYSSDIRQARRNAAMMLDGTSWREGPLLQDGRVRASGCKIVDSGCMDRHSMWERQRTHWELISDDVASDFFEGRTKVMLSSEAGDLQGFRQRFSRLLQIHVYNGQNLSLYMEGNVDMLIYGDDAWPSSDKAEKCFVRQIYEEMLAEDMRRYFQRHGIIYYCCDVVEPVADQAHRIGVKPVGEPMPPQVWSGLQEDYYSFSDYYGDKMGKAVGGHRIDSPPVDGYTRSVYMYGPCTAIGLAFNKTIESKLQELCLANGRKWRVVNCGGSGLGIFSRDINALNWMMHTNFRRGDVVIQLSGYLWKDGCRFRCKDFYYSSDAFDDPEHIHGKYFWDGRMPGHLLEEGFARWGEFLADRLLADERLHEELDYRENIVPYFKCMGYSKAKNHDLGSYIAKLATHRREFNGAIVMNANPFTLGHKYLIESARQQVPFLYVFVVEEDESVISFADRFAMVKQGCSGMKNVEVLPSGRYMISTLTFPEYFQKEQKQEQAVMPSKDIRLFGEAIAPALGIVKRFVGEEPFDNITRQYNESMKIMLLDYGIELIEIPRKLAKNGQPINATQVRKWIEEGAWCKCSSYLPETTLKYLQEHVFLAEKKR